MEDELVRRASRAMDEELRRCDLDRHAAASDVKRVCEAAAKGRKDLMSEARVLLALLEQPGGAATAAVRARTVAAAARLKDGPDA